MWEMLARNFISVTQLCLTFCDPMNCSTQGLPVHHQLPEFTQTQVHRVSDAIQSSHPVIPFSSHLQSLPASESFPISQSFTSGGHSIGVSASASVLPMNIQDRFHFGVTGSFPYLPTFSLSSLVILCLLLNWIIYMKKNLKLRFSLNL